MHTHSPPHAQALSACAYMHTHTHTHPMHKHPRAHAHISLAYTCTHARACITRCACTHTKYPHPGICIPSTHTCTPPPHKHPQLCTHTRTRACAHGRPLPTCRRTDSPPAHARTHALLPSCAHTCPLRVRGHTYTRGADELLLGGGSIVVILDELVLTEEAVGAQGPRPPRHGLSILLQGQRWLTGAAPCPPRCPKRADRGGVPSLTPFPTCPAP